MCLSNLKLSMDIFIMAHIQQTKIYLKKYLFVIHLEYLSRFDGLVSYSGAWKFLNSL